MNGNGSPKSNLYRIVIRNRDKSSISCLQFVQVAYTDHKLLKYRPNIDDDYRHGSGYWKLNKFIFGLCGIPCRIKKLVKGALTGNHSE